MYTNEGKILLKKMMFFFRKKQKKLFDTLIYLLYNIYSTLFFSFCPAFDERAVSRKKLAYGVICTTKHAIWDIPFRVIIRIFAIQLNVMRRMRNWIIVCMLPWLTGCNLIEYHPYDTRIEGETGLTEKNIRLIEEKMQGRKEFRFAMISDTQRSYDETKEVVNVLNSRGDIDFVLHGGDVADFGETKEFLWSRDFLNKLQMPYVCLIGNHDCLGSGFDVYLKVFGEDNFAFTVGNVRFVCLNTNALEYDYSHPVPDFNFMEDEILNMPEGIEKTIVAMHVPPGDGEFNNNVNRAFEHYLNSFPNLLFCLYGHVHSWGENEFFDDGVKYYACANIAKRGYYLISIKEEDYEIERCDF